jgi:hypothetical protein
MHHQHLTCLPHYPVFLALKPQTPSLFITVAVLRPFGAPQTMNFGIGRRRRDQQPREKTVQINVQFGLSMWDADPCGDNVPEWIQ